MQGLDDYGISSQTIREGVLTAKKFSKIEHDEGLGDRMIWDFLLERMSVSPLIYKCYITKDEETLLQKRKVLRSITDELRSIPLNATQQQLEKQKELLKKGKLLVFDYSNAWQNTDAVIQGRLNWNEHSALQEMVDRSDISKALVVADRGYESYNNMAHIQEKGWYFLIRIKDGKNGIKQGLDLPDMNLTKK